MNTEWIERNTATNLTAARAHVASHSADVDAVLASFGQMDEQTASQIASRAGVKTYTVESMVLTGELSQIGYRAGYPLYSL